MSSKTAPTNQNIKIILNYLYKNYIHSYNSRKSLYCLPKPPKKKMRIPSKLWTPKRRKRDLKQQKSNIIQINTRSNTTSSIIRTHRKYQHIITNLKMTSLLIKQNNTNFDNLQSLLRNNKTLTGNYSAKKNRQEQLKQ